MIAMFFVGFVLFFYAILFPWQKVSYYFILRMVFIILFAVLWLVGVNILGKMQLHDKLGEDIAWSIGLACVAGIIASMIGIFTFARSWQRILFAGAALSLLTVAIIMSPLMSPPPIIKYSILMVERILMGLQLFISILLFRIGYIDIKGRHSKVLLITIAVVLIFMGLWGLFGTIIDAGKDFGLSFWNLQMRIIAIVQIIIAFISLYALFKFPKNNEV